MAHEKELEEAGRRKKVYGRRETEGGVLPSLPAIPCCSDTARYNYDKYMIKYIIL
jgi:hypothetical protein